jgi:Predicted 3'-5' exonuclease related to the exonuclease domain of PolB
MGEVRSSIAALIEVFLKDVLCLEGETEAQVREGVRIHVAEYEGMFRAAQLEERDKDLAARVCRALCRRRIIKLVQAGQIDEVARYCETDVLNTYRVWLVYELFRGAITTKDLNWSENQIREFVASRKSANPHLCNAVGIAEGTMNESASN